MGRKSGQAWLWRKLRQFREEHGGYPGPRDLPELLGRLGGLMRRSWASLSVTPTVPPMADRLDAARLGIQALALYKVGQEKPLRARELRREADWASRAGLGGFCFGAAANLSGFPRDLGLDFCLVWGGNAGEPAFERMLPALDHPRYLRVQGRPLLLLRAVLGQAQALAWRQAALRAGLPGLQLLPVAGEGSGPLGLDGPSVPVVGTGPGPEAYSLALAQACDRASGGLVLIQAWDASPLELGLGPSRQHGHAFLHATANALRRHHRDPSLEALLADLNSRFTKRSDSALVFHCHYEDLLEPMAQRLGAACQGMDVFLSFKSDVSEGFVRKAASLFPSVRFLRLENRGRDIRPFLLTLAELRRLGYRHGCKIHSKRSAHLKRGSAWRDALLGALLPGPAAAQHARQRLGAPGGPGLLVAPQYWMDCADPERHQQNVAWLDALLKRMGREDLVGSYGFRFPAGSMFWFRVEALAGLDELGMEGDAFEPELGQLDSTLAHALERLVSVYAEGRGFSTALMEDGPG